MSLTVERTRTRRDAAGIEPPHPTDGTILRLGGFSAAAAAMITPIALAALAIWPPPYGRGAKEWFDLFHENVVLGLLGLDLAFLVIGVLMIPVMLGLFVVLRSIRPGPVTVAAILYLVAVSAYLSTNTSLEMLSLSNRFEVVATETERTALLGAGEAMLATFDGTAFHVYYILAQLAGIIFGWVMFKSELFGRRIVYPMIVGNALGFGLYVPTVGLALSALSGGILWVWMIFLAHAFLKMARRPG